MKSSIVHMAGNPMRYIHYTAGVLCSYKGALTRAITELATRSGNYRAGNGNIFRSQEWCTDISRGL